MSKIVLALNNSRTPIGVGMDAEVAKEIVEFIDNFRKKHSNPTESTIGKAILYQFTDAPMVTNYVAFYELVTAKLQELE